MGSVNLFLVLLLLSVFAYPQMQSTASRSGNPQSALSASQAQVALTGGLPVSDILLNANAQWTGARTHPTDNVVLDWNNAALAAIRGSRLGPPISARALAILHTCIYDAWASYDEKAIGAEYRAKVPSTARSPENRRKAVSFAAYTALVDLYPTGDASIFKPLMNRLGYGDSPVDGPAQVGVSACKAVLESRYHDGANQLGDLTPGRPAYSDWTAWRGFNRPSELHRVDTTIDVNHWQPLVYADNSGIVLPQIFLSAHWYKVRPFALSSGDQFRKLIEQFGPAQNGSREYALQSCELVLLSEHLSDREKVISEYWADGPRTESPPGHWNVLAQYVSRRDNHTLDDDAKMFFALNNALFDVSIAVWDVKRTSESIRPISAIPLLFHDQKIRAWAGPGKGTAEIDGSSWTPYQPVTSPTPPFPEYVSGHSAFSAAGAEILRLWTGSDEFGYSTLVKRGTSRIEPDQTPSEDILLTWETFTDAADQAGMSRRYGGIHFIAGDLVGRELGKLVGAQVWRKSRQLWNSKQVAPKRDFLISEDSRRLGNKLSSAYRRIALQDCGAMNQTLSLAPN